jgi:tripartite-type tricarboxylate transporter receptor subunit TctC
VLKASAVAQRFTTQGLQIYASSPEEFESYLKAEIDKWAKVVKAADIRVD